MDAIVLLLAAGFVTLGVVGSEPGRSPLWALASGLVLGCDAMLNYAVAWLGVSVVAVYFVRRRPLLNVFTGVGALVPAGGLAGSPGSPGPTACPKRSATSRCASGRTARGCCGRFSTCCCC